MIYLLRLVHLLCLPAAVAVVNAQAVFPVTTIPVERNGKALKNAWNGGMNAPQFSNIDLNNDGVNDLFVFDRAGDKVQTYLRSNAAGDTAYTYCPAYEKLFPPMNLWATIRDYNHDGIPDIFTAQTGETDPQGNTVPWGIKVYKGSRINGNLHFDVAKYCLYYTDAGVTTNLWVNGLGMPAIVDVNNDGDLDVVTFNIYGTAAEYYENLTTEQSLPYDSLKYELITLCWGGFYVTSAGTTVPIVATGVNCKGSSAGTREFEPRHSGATLWPLDNQNDSDVDLLVSEKHSTYFALLNNTGSVSSANIGWIDTLWPRCNTPARMPLFPAAFNVDGTNDGFKDIIIAPNTAAAAPDINNVMLYKYETGDTCRYHYAGDSFLVHTTLDFGTDSKIAFFDHNSDGLMDIVAGNYYYHNPVVFGASQLALLENTGTATEPRFTLITTDYANLSAFNTGSGPQALSPAFGDLDGDGKTDMLLGDDAGYLRFFKNTGTATASFPSMTDPDYFGIRVNSYSAPFIYDVNSDSLLDLVVGRMDGRLSYYRNFGTITNPQFHPDSSNLSFGHVNVTAATSTEGDSHPYITTDTAGNMLLLVGSLQGKIFAYAIDTNKLRNGAFTMLDSNFIKRDAGAKSNIQANDLNNDGKVEYILGNAQGGLLVFSQTVWDSSTAILGVTDMRDMGRMSVFPNPAKEQFVCEFDKPVINAQVELYNLLGERITIPYTVQQQGILCQTANLPEGFYILHIQTNNGDYTAKIIIRY